VSIGDEDMNQSFSDDFPDHCDRCVELELELEAKKKELEAAKEGANLIINQNL
jgi:hypothetical protein